MFSTSGVQASSAPVSRGGESPGRRIYLTAWPDYLKWPHFVCHSSGKGDIRPRPRYVDTDAGHRRCIMSPVVARKIRHLEGWTAETSYMSRRGCTSA